MQQFRDMPDIHESRYCLKCFQEEYLKNGIAMYEDFVEEVDLHGTWFDDDDLIKAGYRGLASLVMDDPRFHDEQAFRHTWYVSNDDSAALMCEAIRKICDAGYKVVVSLEYMSIMGDGSCSIWVKRSKDD